MSEFIFEKQPWQEELDHYQAGDQMSATLLLSLMEPEDELTVEQALSEMEQKGIGLDLSQLPRTALTGSIAQRLKQEAENATLEGLLQGLDENDPLRLYLDQLAATPAAGDPELYAQRYCQGEHHLAEQLVNLCLGRVVALALQHTGHGVLLLDLIQEGSLGLWQAILNYQQGEFLPYAQWYITFYMARCIFLNARNAGIGQMLAQSLADYRDTDQRLLTQLGRNPTAQEIGCALHISPEEAERLEKMVANARSMQQTRRQQQPPEPAPEDRQAVEDTAYFQLRQRITELLSGLDQTDARLLTLRFGLEDGKPLSPVQTGQLLGMTAQEVVRREAEALEKLRNF